MFDYSVFNGKTTRSDGTSPVFNSTTQNYGSASKAGLVTFVPPDGTLVGSDFAYGADGWTSVVNRGTPFKQAPVRTRQPNLILQVGTLKTLHVKFEDCRALIIASPPPS